VVVPYPTSDEGRFGVTKNEADRFVFKVPSLRNSEKTAPYFHDGGVKTLEEAVRFMGKHQLGRDLSTEDTASIVTFLRSLTGKLPENIE
jgi:cytochrome c peroxidase